MKIVKHLKLAAFFIAADHLNCLRVHGKENEQAELERMPGKRPHKIIAHKRVSFYTQIDSSFFQPKTTR